MGRKLGALPHFWGGERGLHLTPSRLGEAYIHTKWHLDPSSHLATTGIGGKFGGGGVSTTSMSIVATVAHLSYC